MSRMHLCLELSERELHILTFFPETSQDGFAKLNQVKFDSRPISGGWLKQGQVSTQVLTQIIEEVCDTLKIPKQTPTLLAIPLVNGSIRDYRLPWISPQHRRSAIHYLAREETPIPQNNQVMGYAITEEDKKLKRMTVRLGVTHRSILESLLHVLKIADLKMISVEFTAVAIGNALNLQEQERYLYLRERDEGITVVLYKGILPEITRFFPILPESNPEESVKEIARLFGLYNKNAEEQVRCIFISGRRSEKLSRRLCTLGLPGLDQRAKIVPIERVFQSSSWRESLHREISPCLPCLGLALKCGAKINSQSVNLLAEYLDRERENHRKQLLAALLLSVTASCLGLWFYGKNQETVLTAEINNLRTNVEERQTKDQNITRLYKSWNNLKGDQAGFSTPLIALQSLSGGGVSFEQLEYREGMLTLQGTVERADQLQNLLQALQAQSWGQVRFRQYQQEKPLQIKFSVTALRGG
ncbi:hypothetical protein ACHOLT_09810 [Desulfitobacterium sp. Sab5]|uniref:hypothetical protein n=1 Tax=Desulfitobacterium nosdiversum TaxID=3375356 RepID=UPI003CEA00B4